MCLNDRISRDAGWENILKVLGFISFLVFAAVLAAPPVQAFTSGGWEGQANRGDDGTFRDCTMTADYGEGGRQARHPGAA
jgi:hypothetical protein